MIADDAAIPNLRDVGGHATRRGGRIRTGLLFRSSAPVGLHRQGEAVLAGLGLRTVFDLRSAEERWAAPDALPANVRHLTLDVLEEATDPSPALLDRLLADPKAAREYRASAAGGDMPERRFRDLVILGSARSCFGALFRELADRSRCPALIHCSTGKDRTGWAAAALLTLLGVSADTVISDYLASAAGLSALYRPALETFIAAGGDRELFEWIAGVRPQNLAAALDEMYSVYGTADSYFQQGLEVSPESCVALRMTFIASPPRREPGSARVTGWHPTEPENTRPNGVGRSHLVRDACTLRVVDTRDG